MMKRLFALLLVFTLLLPTALAEDSASARYEAAAGIMLQGDYAAAAEAFTALSGYSDAPQMAIYCNGLALFHAGDYARAEKAFTHLGAYKDAAVWVIACQAYARREAALALAGDRTLGELLEAEDAILQAAALFDQIDYLPAMAAEAAALRDMLLPLQARRFDGFLDANYGMCIVWRGDLYGVINSQGELIIPCEWDWIRLLPTMLIVEKNGKFGLLSLTGEVLHPCTATSCSTYIFDDEYCATLRWDEVLDGQTTTYARYFLPDDTALPRDVEPYEFVSSDLLEVYDPVTYNIGLYHIPTATMVLPCTALPRMLFGDGFIVQEADYFTLSYYSAAGEPREIPEGAWPVHESGIWHISTEDGELLMGLDGNVLFEGDTIGYRSVGSLPDGWYSFYAMVDGATQVYLMNDRHEVVLQAADIREVSNRRYVIVQDEDRQHLLDLEQDNRLLVSADAISNVAQGRYVTLKQSGTQYMLDLETGVLFEAPYRSITPVGENVFKAQDDSKQYVLLDASGQRLTQETYDFVYSYTQGYLKVEQNDVYSMLDTQGNVVLSGYKYINNKGGYFYSVTKTDRYGVLNMQLEELLPCDMYTSGIFYGPVFWTASTHCLHDTQGKVILDMDDFDDWEVDSGCIFTLQDNLLTIYDYAGNRIY